MVTTSDTPAKRPSRFSRSSPLTALGTPAESLRIERVIAVSRLLLTAIAFIAIDLQPVEPPSYAPIAYILLVVFAAHSLSALFVLRRRQKTTLAFALTTHSVDLLAATLTLPMAGPNNSFFTFFLFVLAAAAFRWGFRETLLTTLAAVGLVLVHAQIAKTVPVLSLYGQYDSERVIVRATYLAMMGLLLGYLAEEARLLRAETVAIVTLLGKIKVDGGLTRTLSVVAHEMLGLFNASRVLLVVEDVTNRRLMRWDTSTGWSAPIVAEGESIEADRQRYLMEFGDFSFALVRRAWPMHSTYLTTAIDASGHTVEAARWAMPAVLVSTHPFRQLITVPVKFGDEWVGRVFVFDPRLGVRHVALARFLQVLVRQVAPAIFNVYLLGRLRARAGAIERARVARELHDGVIQSLIGVEMRLEVLRTQDPLRVSPAGGELAGLQAVARDEVLHLRELMQQMRPLEFDPEEMLDHLADMVQRFGRDTGITARFATDLKEVGLQRNVCFELTRIVQEGLVNVRKHSAARSVLVRFGAKEGYWILDIDDDGRGFPFSGRLMQNDLDARRVGPTIIKERVRSIGGQLIIETAPGRGTRLEVRVPQEAHG
jgi:signal transduction histidine kinase